MRRRRTNMKRKQLIGRIVYHVVIMGFAYVMIYPILWMFFASFKDNMEIFADASKLWPEHFDFGNYARGWAGFSGYTFGTFFKNSAVISVISTAATVFSSAIIAYGFARVKFKFQKFWFAVMISTMMLPIQIIMVPQFIIFHKLNMVGTILPVVLPHFFGVPFFIFLMMQFIQGVPRDLDEAAKIDGCSKYAIFYKIILPLMKPALVTATIFQFYWKWDDFLGPLLYLNKPEKYTATLALRLFADPGSTVPWGEMLSMATLSIVPIVLIFLLFQKYLVEGISTSGLKG